MTEPVAVVRVGIYSPVGLDAEQAAASVWAGVARKQETSIMDRRLDPIVIGALPVDVLPPLVAPLEQRHPALTSLQRRLLRLATPALHDVLGVEVDGEATPGQDEPRFGSAVLPAGLQPPLLVAGPQPAPGRPEIMTGEFVAQLALQAGTPADLALSRVFPTGHAGFFAALRHAQVQLFEPGQAELAVVGGVDSYLDLYRLALLDEQERLSTSAVRDAFTPGESAAFALVATRVACRRYGLEPLAWIDAVGVAHEPGHRYSEQPYRGEGLAEAFGQVFGQRDPSHAPVRLVMAGFSGESFHTKEWGVAHIRNRKAFAEPLRIEHSAEYTGDAGAGLAPLMLGVATLAMHEGDVEGPALVWGSSDWGERGALLLRTA